jgi:uncharacterized protein (TIGR00369 family)
VPHPHLVELCNVPYHRYLGLSLSHAEAGRSRVLMQVNAQNANVLGVLHGGAICSVLDVAAYAALISLLDPSESAVTHDIHVSMMRPARPGSELVFEGEVVRKGRTVAFVDARAMVADRLIASARVTKSIVSSEPRTS